MAPSARNVHRSHTRFAALALAALLPAGCHSAMSPAAESPDPVNQLAPSVDRPFTGTVADWPLFFVQHWFNAACYDASGCKVGYAGSFQLNTPENEMEPSIASLGDRYPNSITATSRGPIEGVPGPAKVTWKSKDGTPMQATVDMEEIFRDRLIRHNVRRADIPDRIGIGTPLIVLEVVDRTINVYMQARVPTKEAQIPGNRYSFNRRDLIRVWSQAY